MGGGERGRGRAFSNGAVRTMGVTQMYIGSPKQILPGAFSLATVNPLSWYNNVLEYHQMAWTHMFDSGTGTSTPPDVNLQCITCLVPGIADEAGSAEYGGTDLFTAAFNTLRTVYANLRPTAYQFTFVADFRSYAPGNIRQRIGMANNASTLNDRFFYITNPAAGYLRLEMQNLGGVLNFSPNVAVATGMHKHEIRWSEFLVEWFIDNNLVWSGACTPAPGTFDFPWDASLGPFYHVLHVAGAGSGSYDLNVAFMGGGLVFG